MSFLHKYRFNKVFDIVYNYSPRVVQDFIYSAFGFLKIRESKRISALYKQEYNKIESTSNQGIKDIQLKKLKTLLVHSYNKTKYYKELFDSIGFNPFDFESLNDLKKIPIMDKNTFIDNFSKLKSNNSDMFSPKIHSTGGTTGTTLEFLTDEKAYLKMQYEYLHYCLRHDYVPGKEKTIMFRAGVIVPNGRNANSPWRLDRSRKMLYLSSYYSSDTIFDAYYVLLKKWNPQYMQFLPSAVYLFAKYLNNNHLSIKLKKCFSASEMLHDFQRREIEKAFQCKVIDHYGHSEPGIYVAGQCIENHYHFYPNNVIAEVSDEGELSETSLNNFSMPFIRYKVGDIVDGIHYNCDCGLTTPYFIHIQGREANIVYTGDGRQISDIGFDQIFRGNNILLGQIIQEIKGELILKVVPTLKFTSNDKKNIINKLKERAGQDTAIFFNIEKEIIKSKNNKFNLVISKIKKNYEE